MWIKSILACVFLCGVAAVSGRAVAANAAPLGMEIGVAKYDQVKAEIGKTTELADDGVAALTGGKMLSGAGKGLEVNGLNKITFIFDKSDVLQAVVMTMAKDFKPTYGMLSKKYKLVSKKVPFVGDSEATFSQGDSVILLEAPHLSFSMILTYQSKALQAALSTRMSRDKAKKEKDQQDKL